ncbi:hypothetical protein U1Q18_008120 [Sarracenia purpurea var. burkii]
MERDGLAAAMVQSVEGVGLGCCFICRPFICVIWLSGLGAATSVEALLGCLWGVRGWMSRCGSARVGGFWYIMLLLCLQFLGVGGWLCWNDIHALVNNVAALPVVFWLVLLDGL